MAYEFRFPDVGEGITEGELLSWKVREGDVIAEDQTLAEVETDKAVVEIPSPKAGKILKLHAQEGEIIKVGAVLVTIEAVSYTHLDVYKRQLRDVCDLQLGNPEIRKGCMRCQVLR